MWATSRQQSPYGASRRKKAQAYAKNSGLVGENYADRRFRHLPVIDGSFSICNGRIADTTLPAAVQVAGTPGERADAVLMSVRRRCTSSGFPHSRELELPRG
jgi:hypothetical protein